MTESGIASNADYRKILRAYIEHVGYAEGSDFIGDGIGDPLTTEEDAALVALAKEVRIQRRIENEDDAS